MTTVMVRGLLALGDTRTWRHIKRGQPANRAGIMVVPVGQIGAGAVRLAGAVIAALETVAVGVALLVRRQRRMAAPVVAPRLGLPLDTRR